MPVIEERVSQLESAVTRLVEETSIVVAAMREHTAVMRASNATREKLSGIAMGDEVMEVVNLGQF